MRPRVVRKYIESAMLNDKRALEFAVPLSAVDYSFSSRVGRPCDGISRKKSGVAGQVQRWFCSACVV